jgi:hypothetical protein
MFNNNTIYFILFIILFIIFNKKKSTNIRYKKRKITKRKAIIKFIIYNDTIYKLLGKASNTYTNTYFHVFEHKIRNKELRNVKNNQIYKYILVKIYKNKPYVVHYINPRSKIKINDIVYFKLPSSGLGPFTISN